ncbi:MAG: SHOCT domain-containing protein [Hyphomicrobiaceae bacterium]
MHDEWTGWFGGHWWLMPFGSLTMWLPFALLIAIILFVVIRPTGQGGTSKPARSPREILDERLAKGEIDLAEYEKRRKTLDG